MSSSDRTPPPASVVGPLLIPGGGGAPKAAALAVLPALAMALDLMIVLLGPMGLDVLEVRLCVLCSGEGGGERRGRAMSGLRRNGSRGEHVERAEGRRSEDERTTAGAVLILILNCLLILNG